MRCTGVAGISASWKSIHLIHLVRQPVTILVALLDAFQFVDISPVPGEPNLVPLGSSCSSWNHLVPDDSSCCSISLP